MRAKDQEVTHNCTGEHEALASNRRDAHVPPLERRARHPLLQPPHAAGELLLCFARHSCLGRPAMKQHYKRAATPTLHRVQHQPLTCTCVQRTTNGR
eukprot:COSAG06_NODE_3920_length_4768_cov_2.703363_5_plen_97_part_00